MTLKKAISEILPISEDDPVLAKLVEIISRIERIEKEIEKDGLQEEEERQGR